MGTESGNIPTIGRIRALVLEDLSRIGLDASDKINQITVADLKKPHLHSTLLGCAVTVQFTDRLNRPRRIDLWVKKVRGGRADKAFAAMDAVYRLLKDADLQGPMPEPLFFDRATD